MPKDLDCPAVRVKEQILFSRRARFDLRRLGGHKMVCAADSKTFQNRVFANPVAKINDMIHRCGVRRGFVPRYSLVVCRQGNLANGLHPQSVMPLVKPNQSLSLGLWPIDAGMDP